MIYKYKGIDTNGNSLKDRIEASSLEEAKAKLRAKNILYSSLEEDTLPLFERLSFQRRYKISAKELSLLSRELAMYLRSGMSIVAALQVVASHYKNNKKLKLFITSVSTNLDEGENLYSALKMQDVALLPEFYMESIRVSENGGMLDEVLLELSRFLKEQERIAKEIKGAFAYPTFMIVLSLVMIAFMLTYVVPQITGIFESMDQKLPTPTVVVITMGDFFSHHFSVVLVSIFTIVAVFVLLRRKVERFAYAVDSFVLKLPLFGSIVRKSEIARFAYIASLLTRSGVVFVQTINLSANILTNRVLKKVFIEASEEVVEGKLLSLSLQKRANLIDDGFIQAIALGEETSEVQSVLQNISELYFEENKDTISLLLTLLEPALMLFVGGSIGFIVAAMLLPIFSMSIH